VAEDGGEDDRDAARRGVQTKDVCLVRRQVPARRVGAVRHRLDAVELDLGEERAKEPAAAAA